LFSNNPFLRSEFEKLKRWLQSESNIILSEDDKILYCEKITRIFIKCSVLEYYALSDKTMLRMISSIEFQRNTT
jgi:hypothetical protein